MVTGRLWDVLIVGAGPAGCTAALFAALGGQRVLLTEKCAVGGGMLHAPEIRDWPGEPDPIDGIALGERMRKQVLAAGALLRYGEITGVTLPTDSPPSLSFSPPLPPRTVPDTTPCCTPAILSWPPDPLHCPPASPPKASDQTQPAAQPSPAYTPQEPAGIPDTAGS